MPIICQSVSFLFKKTKFINLFSYTPAEDIQTVMTVRQIYTRAEGQLRDNSEQFTAVLYAMITHFDIDWPGLVLSKRWLA